MKNHRLFIWTLLIAAILALIEVPSAKAKVEVHKNSAFGSFAIQSRIIYPGQFALFLNRATWFGDFLDPFFRFTTIRKEEDEILSIKFKAVYSDTVVVFRIGDIESEQDKDLIWGHCRIKDPNLPPHLVDCRSLYIRVKFRSGLVVKYRIPDSARQEWKQVFDFDPETLEDKEPEEEW